MPPQQPLSRVEEAHRHSAKRVLFSPDGSMVATVGVFGKLKVWSVPDLQLLHADTVHEWRARGLAWTPVGQLVTADDDGLIAVRGRDFQLEGSFQAGSGVLALEWVEGAGQLVAGLENGTLQTVALDDQDNQARTSFNDPVSALTVDRSGSSLAVVLDGEEVLLLDAQFRTIRKLQPPEQTLFDLSFSPDGKYLVGSGWFRLHVWDLEDGTYVDRETHHYGKIGAVDISPDSRYVASISRVIDSAIYLYSLEDARLLKVLKKHALCGSDLDISPDGRYLASVSDDASVRIYDLAEGGDAVSLSGD